MDSRIIDESRVLLIYCGGTIGMLSSEVGHVPHSGFLASNLRSQARFHDPNQDSVFAHSGSVTAFSNWSKNDAVKSNSGSSTPTSTLPSSFLTVKTTTGSVTLPSLITPKTSFGKRIRYAILEYDPLIDSSEVELKDWIKIASDIELNYSSFDSFIILHGTDTMAYTASALSFLLEDLGKTVIITGAQIPLSELFNDSIDNLLGSLIIAGHFRIPEVSLFFNHKLLRGNRSIKASSDEFDAFASPSLPPLATVGIDIEVAWNEIQPAGLKPFHAHKAMSPHVATLRIFPGISGSSVRAFLNAGGIKGVIIETFGAGNATRREELLSAFREAAERGVVIVNVSQCSTGSVQSEIYETGRILAAVGITGGADMTTECALAKLSYLLSKPELSPAQIRKLISKPLRGELTLVSPIPAFSSPVESEDRIRNLFAQVIDCSPFSTSRNPVQRGRSLSTSIGESMESNSDSTLKKFEPPLTVKDAEAAERAVLPFLLGQASSRSGPLLSEIISSLLSDTTVVNDSTLSLLSEPCTISAGQTPLHIAVLSSQLENVQLLLKAGASVHARDHLCHSVLFYAAKQGKREIIIALKDVGAHLSSVEIEGGDVGLEIARASKRGNEEDIEGWKVACGEDFEKAGEYLKRIME